MTAEHGPIQSGLGEKEQFSREPVIVTREVAPLASNKAEINSIEKKEQVELLKKGEGVETTKPRMQTPEADNPGVHQTLLYRPPLKLSTRITWRNSFHLLLTVLPNLCNPHKLLDNIKHPFHEFIHTHHRQRPLKDNPRIHVVEHEFFGRLLTVDIIEEDKFSIGFSSRLKQLFAKDFYYGHCEYFPKPFRLINRTYVKDQNFDLDNHVLRMQEKLSYEKITRKKPPTCSPCGS